MQTNHFFYGKKKKKKATTTTLQFFQKSFTAIKENTLKKFYCLCATIWGQFKKKKLSPFFFFLPAIQQSK